MGMFQKLWCCECPVPGTQPLITCTECKKRECFEWSWSDENVDGVTILTNNNRDVLFNPGFSVGTAAVKGNIPLKPGYHHFWEIEMSSDVYGTDMMIGVGTDKAELTRHQHNFVSFLGLDENSWGMSYTGTKQHNGKLENFTKPFGSYTVVGVHLDMWTGCLFYYLNRKPVGMAYSGLQGKVLYPMISSTAARSKMNLIFSRSYAPSLQLQTLLSIGQSVMLPDNISLFKVLPDDIVPPGLKLWMKNNFWWITSTKLIDSCLPNNDSDKKRTEKKSGQKTTPPRILISDTSQGAAAAVSSGPLPIRRGRKARKESSSLDPPSNSSRPVVQEGVTTRSKAARLALPLLTPGIFTGETPNRRSPRLSRRAGVTRSSSSPSVPNALEKDGEDVLETELPPRAASSAAGNSDQRSGEETPECKRRCFRLSRPLMR